MRTLIPLCHVSAVNTRLFKGLNLLARRSLSCQKTQREIYCVDQEGVSFISSDIWTLASWLFEVFMPRWTNVSAVASHLNVLNLIHYFLYLVFNGSCAMKWCSCIEYVHIETICCDAKHHAKLYL